MNGSHFFMNDGFNVVRMRYSKRPASFQIASLYDTSMGVSLRGNSHCIIEQATEIAPVNVGSSIGSAVINFQRMIL